MQRLIEWRIHNQKMEERVLLESIRNEERLEIAGRLQDALGNKLKKCDKDNMMEIDIQTGEDVETNMDWCVVESREHAY